MLSKILLCTIRGKSLFHKKHVFLWIIFFLKKGNSVDSFISICLSDLKDKKLPLSAIKTQIEDNRPKILLARRAHKRSRQLALAIMARIGQSGHLLMSKPDSCEIISKSDQRFQRRFFKNFFMSVKCKKPPFTRVIFIDRSKFCEQFLKRVTQGIFL